MKKRLFPLLIALSALAVSGSAAFYSVFGLSKLFAGAATQVIIMAGSLEFAKLVAASLLYQYWDTINTALKGYLMVAVFTLMVITSGGIYGFLSGAYQSTATQSELLDKSLAILNQKQIRFEETKEDLTIEKNQINQSISDLRVSLSNPTSVSWYDKEAEQVITTTSSSTRRALQKELETAIIDRDNINLKLEAVLDSIGKTDMALLEKEIDNEDQRELGPLKYLAGITGWPMDRVVNWFLLLIIFVFDPLAIALVVAANFAFAQIKKPEEEEKEDKMTNPSESLKQRVKENQAKLKEIDEEYFGDLEDYIEYTREEDPDNLTYPKFVDKHYPSFDKEVKMSVPDGLEFNTPYTMDQISAAFEKEKDKKVEKILEIDEKRMSIIGQNGNDGLHYDNENQPKNIITSTEELTEKEIEDLSKEIAKSEKIEEDTPINPQPQDLEKLAKALNINYNDDDVEIDRLTDTTQTLLTKTINKIESEEVKSESKLKYKGRK